MLLPPAAENASYAIVSEVHSSGPASTEMGLLWIFLFIITDIKFRQSFFCMSRLAGDLVFETNDAKTRRVLRSRGTAGRG